MKKKIFYTEAAFLIGILLLAVGTALTEFGGFGISMVVAPAYILHLKVSQTFAFFSFGMAEYVLQTVILFLMMLLLRKIRGIYFLSILTAVFYGAVLDIAMKILAIIPYQGLPIRLTLYIIGVLFCCAGISLLFHTYLPPEVYEMFVKEVSKKFCIELHKFKIIYDCTSCVIAIGMALVFFGELNGIGVGTVLCAFLNGILIHQFSKGFEKMWEFKDGLRLRNKFEESEVMG